MFWQLSISQRSRTRSRFYSYGAPPFPNINTHINTHTEHRSKQSIAANRASPHTAHRRKPSIAAHRASSHAEHHRTPSIAARPASPDTEHCRTPSIVAHRASSPTGFYSSLYFMAFSYTVAFWHRSLFHGIFAHGRFLASLLIARRSRSRSRFGIALFHGIFVHGRFLASLLIARRSRSRSRFGIALYFTVFSLTVAFWHRSLLYGVLAHGRVFGIALYFTLFSLIVAFWHRSLLYGVLAHGRVLALLCISHCSRTWSYFVALSISHCFCGPSDFRTDFSSIKYSFYLVLFRNSIPSDFSFLVSF